MIYLVFGETGASRIDKNAICRISKMIGSVALELVVFKDCPVVYRLFAQDVAPILDPGLLLPVERHGLGNFS